MTLPVLVFIAFSGVGFALLLAGLVGRRVDRAPRCRRCTIPLGESIPGSCPNCARDLRTRRSVKRGARRPIRSLVGAGGAALLLTTLLGGTSFWLNAFDFDWNTIKTDAMLVKEIREPRLGVSSRAVLERLLARLRRGDLSRAASDSILELALDAQADAEGAQRWTPLYGDFVEAAWNTGRLKPDQLDRYLDNAIQIDRTRVRVGECELFGGVMFDLRVSARVADNSRLQFAPLRIEHTIDGANPASTQEEMWFTQAWQHAFMGEQGSSAGFFTAPEQTVRMRHVVHLIDGSELSSLEDPSILKTSDDRSVTPTHRVVAREFEQTVEVTNPFAPPLETFEDPALRASIRSAIDAVCFVERIEPEQESSGAGAYSRLHAEITCETAPAPLCFDVFVRTDAGLYRLGAIAPSTSEPSRFTLSRDIGAARPFRPNETSATIVLRTNPYAFVRPKDEAIYDRLSGAGRVWRGELTLDETPLSREHGAMN